VLVLLRQNRDYRFLVASMVVSLMGDWFATVALAGLVLDRTNNDFFATMVFVAASLPAFFMTPFAGPLADRFDRRKIMIVCSLLQTFAALFLLLAHRWWGVGIAAQACIAAIAAFFGPASSAALPNLVEPKDLPTVTAASGTIWGAMLVVGSGLGAIVADAFGRTTAFALDALSFVVAAVLITQIRGTTKAVRNDVVRSARMHPISDTMDAIRYARSNRYVSAFLMSKFGFGLGSGVVGLLAVLAKRRFARGDAGTGLLLAARGIGVVVGPLVLRWVARKGRGALLLACGLGSCVYGVGYLGVSRLGTLWLAALLILFAHLGGGVQWTGTFLGLQQSSPDEFRGRIMAADFALVTLSMSISLVGAGLASQHFGPGPVLAVLGFVQIAWGLLFLARTRDLRSQ
jgi:MFS family permease